MSTPFSILVLSPNYHTREMLSRYLPHHEFTVYSADNLESALDIFEIIPLDAAIIELDLQVASGLDLLQWLQEKYPDMHTILICEEDDKELSLCLKTSRSSYIVKQDLNLLNFKNRLLTMCPYKRGLNYHFAQISLHELIQLASFSPHHTQLYLTSSKSEDEGILYFGGGQLQSAIYGKEIGDKAFASIMQLQRGLFIEYLDTPFESDEERPEEDTLPPTTAHFFKDYFNGHNMSPPPTRCVILAKEKNLYTYLSERFVLAAQEVALDVELYDTTQEAFPALETNPELMIIDIDAKFNINELYTFLQNNLLTTDVILVGKVLVPGLNQSLSYENAVRFFVKPGQFHELAELIEEAYLTQKFSGELSTISLFQVLQTFVDFKMSRLLEVIDFFSGKAGQVIVHHGDILHATFGEEIGRDALKLMLEVSNGVFRQNTYWHPDKPNLNVPFKTLKAYFKAKALRQQTPPLSTNEILLRSGEMLKFSASNIEQFKLELINQRVFG